MEEHAAYADRTLATYGITQLVEYGRQDAVPLSL